MCTLSFRVQRKWNGSKSQSALERVHVLNATASKRLNLAWMRQNVQILLSKKSTKPTKNVHQIHTMQGAGRGGRSMLQWIQVFHVAGYAIGWMKIMLMCRWNWWRCIQSGCRIAQANAVRWAWWRWWQCGCSHCCYCGRMTRCKKLQFRWTNDPAIKKKKKRIH